MKLEFTVPGPPVPKARARVVTRPNRAGKMKTSSFTPATTAQYEQHVKLHALAARCKANRWPWQDTKARYGIRIEIHRSVRRGDWDNFAKAITDACNGVVWPDDRQIVSADVHVFEVGKGFEKVEVEVAVYGGMTR